MPVDRIELPTFGLQNRCSTAELNRPTTTLFRLASKIAPQKTCAGGLTDQMFTNHVLYQLS